MGVKIKVVPLLIVGGLFAVVGSQFYDPNPTSSEWRKPDDRVVYLTAVSKFRPAQIQYGAEPGLPRQDASTDRNGFWKGQIRVPVGSVVWLTVLPGGSVTEIGCGVSRRGHPGDHKLETVATISCGLTVT